MGLLNQNNETKSNWEGINEKVGVIFEDQEHLFFFKNPEKWRNLNLIRISGVMILLKTYMGSRT